MLKFWLCVAITAALTSAIASVDFSWRMHEAALAAVRVPAPATAAVRRKFLLLVFMGEVSFELYYACNIQSSQVIKPRKETVVVKPDGYNREVLQAMNRTGISQWLSCSGGRFLFLMISPANDPAR
jgi:hypothetical protein